MDLLGRSGHLAREVVPNALRVGGERVQSLPHNVPIHNPSLLDGGGPLIGDIGAQDREQGPDDHAKKEFHTTPTGESQS